MTYDVAYWARVEPNGEDPRSIERTWNGIDPLTSSVGYAIILDGGVLQADEGENGNDDRDQMLGILAGVSGMFPKAVFRLISEGEDLGDWPKVAYFHNARYYELPLLIPEFDNFMLRPLPGTREALVQQAEDEERFGGPNLGMRVEDMEPYDPGDV